MVLSVNSVSSTNMTEALLACWAQIHILISINFCILHCLIALHSSHTVFLLPFSNYPSSRCTRSDVKAFAPQFLRLQTHRSYLCSLFQASKRGHIFVLPKHLQHFGGVPPKEKEQCLSILVSKGLLTC
jgi:hypothetical protein